MSHRKSNRSRGRDNTKKTPQNIAKRSLPRVVHLRKKQPRPSVSRTPEQRERRRQNMDYAVSLGNLEDRRSFHPEGRHRAARTVSGVPHSRLVPAKPRNPGVPVRAQSFRSRFDVSGPATRLQFATPNRVIRCIRRKIRKEVLLALKLGGRNGGGKPYRRDAYSEVSC